MPASKLIPAKHARIFWNDDPSRSNRAGGTDVLVLDKRASYGDPSHLSCSAGAFGSEWMVGRHALDRPAGVFASVWLRRGASPDAIRAALVQFAHIEGCGWANQMLAAFDYADGLE